MSTDDGTNEVKKQAVQGSTWRAAIEQRFEAWGRGVVRQRWLALILSVAATGFLLSYLPQLEIDNSTEAMLMADDPAVIQYNAFRAQFGRDDKIIVAVDGGDIFSLAFLEQLRVLHEAFELVEKELIDRDEFRAFTFENVARFYTDTNPDFFKGTVVEQEVEALLTSSETGTSGD